MHTQRFPGAGNPKDRVGVSVIWNESNFWAGGGDKIQLKLVHAGTHVIVMSTRSVLRCRADYMAVFASYRHMHGDDIISDCLVLALLTLTSNRQILQHYRRENARETVVHNKLP